MTVLSRPFCPDPLGRPFRPAWLGRAALLAPVVVVLGFGSAGPGRAASPGPTTSSRFVTPAGNAPSHLSPGGTSVLPDGRFATPAGRTIGVDLVPLNVALSHDGRRLYVSDEGEDNLAMGRGDQKYNRFVSMVDTTTLVRQRVEDDALQYGMSENPAGTELYVSEGASDSVGVFAVTGGPLRRIGKVQLQTADFPWGLAAHPSAPFVYATGFMGNSLNVVDTRTRRTVARVDTGEFPYDAVVSPDGKRLYVSNFGVYNTQAAALRLGLPVPPVAVPPATAAGYNMAQSSSIWTYDISNPATPTVVSKLRIGRDVNGYDVLSGSLPSSLAVSPDGRALAVTASNNDMVALIDTATSTIRRTIDTRAVPGGPTGSQPNAVRWSPVAPSFMLPREVLTRWRSTRPRPAPCSAASPPAGTHRRWPCPPAVTMSSSPAPRASAPAPTGRSMSAPRPTTTTTRGTSAACSREPCKMFTWALAAPTSRRCPMQ